MSDLPRDPDVDGPGDDDAELDQPDDLETEIDDEAEAGDEPEPEGDEEPEPPPRQTRRERGRAFGEQIRELRTQNENLGRQIEELRRPAPQRVDPAAQQAAEAQFFEQLEMMPPREAYRALLQYGQRIVGQQLQMQQVNTQENFDKQSYEARAQSSRVHQQYATRVEALVATERARGNMVPRETALKFLLGEDAINRANRVAPAQRRAGAARVAAQTVPPRGARGDVARGGPRRNRDADDEAMLRGIMASDI